MSRFTPACLLLSAVAFAWPALAREWTNTAGKTIEAELVSSDATSVRLKRTNGQTVKIPLDKLSRQDRDWLDQQYGGSRRRVKRRGVRVAAIRLIGPGQSLVPVKDRGFRPEPRPGGAASWTSAKGSGPWRRSRGQSPWRVRAEPGPSTSTSDCPGARIA